MTKWSQRWDPVTVVGLKPTCLVTWCVSNSLNLNSLSACPLDLCQLFYMSSHDACIETWMDENVTVSIQQNQKSFSVPFIIFSVEVGLHILVLIFTFNFVPLGFCYVPSFRFVSTHRQSLSFTVLFRNLLLLEDCSTTAANLQNPSLLPPVSSQQQFSNIHVWWKPFKVTWSNPPRPVCGRKPPEGLQSPRRRL